MRRIISNAWPFSHRNRRRITPGRPSSCPSALECGWGCCSPFSWWALFSMPSVFWMPLSTAMCPLSFFVAYDQIATCPWIQRSIVALVFALPSVGIVHLKEIECLAIFSMAIPTASCWRIVCSYMWHYPECLEIGPWGYSLVGTGSTASSWWPHIGPASLPFWPIQLPGKLIILLSYLYLEKVIYYWS